MYCKSVELYALATKGYNCLLFLMFGKAKSLVVIDTFAHRLGSYIELNKIKSLIKCTYLDRDRPKDFFEL